MLKQLIKLFLILVIFLSNCVNAGEIYKILPAKFDLSNSIIFIPTKASSQYSISNDIQYSKAAESNTISIDIKNAKIEPQPKDVYFSTGDMKEFQIFQFNNDTVRIIINLNQNYNLSNLKIGNINNNIFIIISKPQPFLMNYYINTYREINSNPKDYKEDLIVTERTLNKVSTPLSDESKYDKTPLNDVNQAFLNATYKSSELYTEYKINNLTPSSKLRTKYYFNNASVKDSTFLIEGAGELCIQKPFMLEAPLRMVFDIPNTILNKNIHNTELNLSNGDKLKVAQFNPNTVRMVVTSENAAQYIPVFASDSQTLMLAAPQNLLTTHLPKYKTNIVKTTYQKSGEINNLLFEFDKPLVYSIKRTSKYIFLYFLNAENYNDNNFKNAVYNTPYSDITINTMKNAGIRLTLPTNTRDNISTYISPEGRVFKLASEERKNNDIVKNEENLEQTKKREGVITSLPKYNSKNKNKKIIVIDAGHGGKDYGAIRENVNEKDINLEVANILKNILEKKGHKVYMTRTDDTFVSLEDRTIYTEGINPAVFISIHVNSCNTETPKGIETHYYHDNSLELADYVHTKLTNKINHTPNRGLLKSRFYVINHTTVPAILVEIGFISNAEERNELLTPKRKQRTAEGIAEGLIEYFNSQK